MRAVAGIGAEVLLTVEGELPRSRLYRSHEQGELVAAIPKNGGNVRGEGEA